MRVLIAILTTIIFSSFLSVSFTNALTGSSIHDQIVENLETKGLLANPSIDASRIFPSCPLPISINKLFGSWKTVQVVCPKTNWKLAVRTNIGAIAPFHNTRRENKVNPDFLVKLSTSLDRGEVIMENHLSLSKVDKKVAGGVFYDKDHIVGRTLKRALSVGTIIRARHLNPNWIISKDQLVTIEHQVGSVIISAKGIAQESGQIGQRIWVNNFNSGKKVLCWIKNDKKVTTNAKIY